MKKHIVGVFALCLVPSWLWAAQISLTWDAMTNTASYRVYQSVDGGVTWTQAAEATTPAAMVTVPDDRLVLFRVSAVNPTGETINFTRGAWYNGKWATTPAALRAN